MLLNGNDRLTNGCLEHEIFNFFILHWPSKIYPTTLLHSLKLRGHTQFLKANLTQLSLSPINILSFICHWPEGSEGICEFIELHGQVNTFDIIVYEILLHKPNSQCILALVSFMIDMISKIINLINYKCPHVVFI